MNLLHETIREYDLVLMTLASEIPDLVSVHGNHGELLFSSLGLSRFSEEHVIEEAAKKLISDAAFGEDTASSIIDELASSSAFATFLRTRNGLLKQFEITVTASNNGTYFLKWLPLEIANTH